MEEYIFWLEAVQAIALVAGAFIALFAIHSARKSERQKALLAFMRDYINEEIISDAFVVIRNSKPYDTLDEKEKRAGSKIPA